MRLLKVFSLSLTLFLAACDNNSSSSEFTTPVIATPAPIGFSGNGQLGIIIGGIVSVTNLSGEELVTAVTNSTGDFGPINLPETHSGPVIVTISPATDGTSTYLCDFPDGCLDTARNTVAFGQPLEYTSTLSAIVNDPANINDVNVNPVTTAVQKRAEQLGNDTDAITQANTEMATSLTSLLGTEITGEISNIPNVDLVNGADEDLSDEQAEAAVVLSLLNAGLISLVDEADANSTIDTVIDSLTSGFAETGTFEATSGADESVGSDDLLLATEQQITRLIAAQPENAAELGTVVPDIELDTFADALAETRNDIIPNVPVITGTPTTTIQEDTAYSFQPAAETESGTLTFSVTGNPSWTSFSTETGLLSGTPENADVGVSDDITISVTNGTNSASLDVFTITVQNVNDAPVISGEPTTALFAGETYSFTPTASDIDSTTLQFSATGVSGGLQLDTTTGALTGTPGAGDAGTIGPIVITVSDGDLSAALAEFSVVVTLPFVAVADSIETAKGSATEVAVLENDTISTPNSVTLAIATQPTGGTASIESNQIVYQSNSDFAGDDSLVYTLTDAVTSFQTMATVSIFVDDQPVAVDDTTDAAGVALTTPVNTLLSGIDVLSNDTGLGNTPVTVTIVSSPGGTATVTTTNTIDFTPAQGTTSETTITYQVADDDGDTATATVTIYVDDQPVAVQDFERVLVNSALDPIAVLENDTGLGNTPITVSLVAGTEVGGTATLNMDQTVSFVLETDFLGSAGFEYTITDDDGDSATIDVLLEVSNVVAEPDTANILVSDGNGIIDILANDFGLENLPITVTLLDTPTAGSAVVNGDNTVTYTITDDAFGGADPINYRVTDGIGFFSESVINIFVDDTPLAVKDTTTTMGVTEVIIPVLTFGMVADSGLRNTPISIAVSDPANGTAQVVTVDDTSQVSYTPGVGFFGTEIFTYTITDADGDMSTAEIEVFVDDEPTATNDTVGIEPGQTIMVAVLDNDMGLGNPPLTVEVVGAPANSTANIDGNEIELITDATFPCVGDSFTYRVTDVDGDSSTATVTVDVNPFEGVDDFFAETAYGPGGVTPCNYTPPIGIPEPWGITETHEMYDGMDGYSDAGNGPYTHYVDNTDPFCVDDIDGTEASPSCTIPLDIPAGSVVEIHGGPYTFSTRTFIQANGTEEAPVFIRGVDSSGTYPTFTSANDQKIFLDGTYTVIEHLNAIEVPINLGCPSNQTACTTAPLNPLNQFIVARFLQVRLNQANSNGMTVYDENMAIFNSHIHHNQNERRHGVVLEEGSNKTFVLDTYLHHNGDNDIQYTDGAETNQADFVFVGRNLMHSSREVGLATKWVRNTVVSQNVIHSFLPSPNGVEFCFDDGSACIIPTSGGVGTGIIVGADGFPQSKWILYNKIYDVPNCIRIEEAVATYIIGNQCLNTSSSGIRLEKDSPTLEMSHNTFFDVDVPIQQDFQPIEWDPELHNNLMVNPRSFMTRWTQSAARSVSTWENNLMWNGGSPFSIQWQSTDNNLTTAAGVEDLIDEEVESISGTIVADPLLTDPANADDNLTDLSLSNGSPAIGAATTRLLTLDALFKSIFGDELTLIPADWQDSQFDVGAVPKED